MEHRRNSLPFRAFGTVLLLLAAAAPAGATAPGRLDAAAATRLQARSGLGPDPVLAARWQGLSRDAAVTALVQEAAAHKSAATAAPAWVDEPLTSPRRGGQERTAEERRALVRQITVRGLELQSWWMQEMLTTPAPLAERMTLFWHGHFTSGLREVRSPQLMYRQNVTLRRYALGNYADLLHAIARDPAMLLYLNNQQNRSGAPNENFARELLELFTLGEGHYTEQDIHEAARAFTGWKMQPPDGRFLVVRRQHDDDEKQFLGARGRLDGDDIIAQILKQPRAAEFIVEKLWAEFVSPTPDPAAVRQLAAGFRRDWEIAPLVRALLLRAAAQEPGDAGQLVKSPVEFVVGTVRSLGLQMPPRAAALVATQMGQSLFAPPNVRGWPGGDTWITTQSLLARREFVLALNGEATPIEQRAPMPASDDAVAVLDNARQRARDGAMRVAGRLHADFAQFAESKSPAWGRDSLLVRAPVDEADSGATPADRLAAVLLDPTYHLK